MDGYEGAVSSGLMHFYCLFLTTTGTDCPATIKTVSSTRCVQDDSPELVFDHQLRYVVGLY
jgi:hypothetical protein